MGGAPKLGVQVVVLDGGLVSSVPTSVLFSNERS